MTVASAESDKFMLIRLNKKRSQEDSYSDKLAPVFN